MSGLLSTQSGVNDCDSVQAWKNPPMIVAKPEKTVKRINGRRETEIIDTESVRNRRHERESHPDRAGERIPGRNGAGHVRGSSRPR